MCNFFNFQEFNFKVSCQTSFCLEFWWNFTTLKPELEKKCKSNFDSDKWRAFGARLNFSHPMKVWNLSEERFFSVVPYFYCHSLSKNVVYCNSGIPRLNQTRIIQGHWSASVSSMIRPGPSSVVVHSSPTSSFLSRQGLFLLPVNQKEEKSKRRKDQNYITKANYIHQR